LAQVPAIKGFSAKREDSVMVSTEVPQPLPHFVA